MFRDEQNGGTIVDKILKEISETLGDGVAFEDVPHEDAFKFLTREMPYLNATVRETLRLHPSVPKNIKFSKSEDTLPDGTIVPAGIAVMWSPYAMARNPNIWGKDAKQYRPSRWFEDQDISKSLAKDPPSSIYPVFHHMPRLCLGKGLALMEISLLTAALLQKYSFKPAMELSSEYTSTLVLPMKKGLHVRAQRRSNMVA